MSKLSRTKALEYISNWSTTDVIEILKKNGLEECCSAILKRQIDGDELLHLTEGKLALWKSDLSRPQTWSLWTFVEEINRAPEEHVVAQNIQNDQEPVSDSGSWGTDFEDDDDEDDSSVIKKNSVVRKNNIPQRSTDFRNSLMVFQNREKLARNQKQFAKINNRPESIYMNCAEDAVDNGVRESAYMNLDLEERSSKVVTEMQKEFERTLSEQLKEQLKLRSGEKVPIKSKKPETLPEKPRLQLKPRSPSFLSTRTLSSHNVINTEIKKPITSPPILDKIPLIPERPDDLPKPPLMIRNFDLVANLPTKTDESDDEYEAFDEQIIEQNRLKVGSNQSLIQRSIESVYKPPSTTSQEKEDGEEVDCELYESITENPDDSTYYIQPISPARDLPPLPINSSLIESSCSSLMKTLNKNERSPDKKSATLPHPGSSTSLSAEMRATRPLPPPPFGQSYMNFPWFHNVTREQASTSIKERACTIAHNGYFLVRPSTSDINSPLVLVVWLKDRVYNVPVRKRADGRFALGSLKANELSFTNVEEIIIYYSREELVLYSGGRQMGSTKLTDTPPK